MQQHYIKRIAELGRDAEDHSLLEQELKNVPGITAIGFQDTVEMPIDFFLIVYYNKAIFEQQGFLYDGRSVTQEFANYLTEKTERKVSLLGYRGPQVLMKDEKYTQLWFIP